jgi:hypothetical protein
MPTRNKSLPNIVSIPLQPGECREERADDLRQWCAANCAGDWEPLERWTAEAVRIGFASASDAENFHRSVWSRLAA